MRNNFPDINHKLEFRIITNYPEMFPGALNFSLIGKALKNGLWDFKTINLRDFGEGNHKKIDDPPAPRSASCRSGTTPRRSSSSSSSCGPSCARSTSS